MSENEGVRLDQIALDTEGVEGGVWTELSAGFDVKVRSINSRKVKDIQRKHNAQNRKYTMRRKQIPSALQEKQALELVCDGFLVDWRKRLDMDGEPYAFTSENVWAFFSDARFAHLLDEVSDFALDASEFMAEDEAEELGN